MDLINLMYRGPKTIKELEWDSLYTIPLLQVVTVQDIADLRKLILSPRYSGNARAKLKMIDEIMHNRGFTKFAGGTNRVVYTHPSAPNAVFKVAIDSVGINDNPAEFRNQQFLKPYCCKVFECSPCGTIASFEKVDRITTFDEFYSIADDYFYLLLRVILGKYVMEDIGIDYFMNIGIRKGFGPVLLDFPYLFELDGAKLICSRVLDDGHVCRGEVEYDDGFNKLICKKCQKHYNARDLAKSPKGGGVIVYRKGKEKMEVKILEGDKVIKCVNTEVEREFLSNREKRRRERIERRKRPIKVSIVEEGEEPTKEPSASKNKPVLTAKVVEIVNSKNKDRKPNKSKSEKKVSDPIPVADSEEESMPQINFEEALSEEAINNLIFSDEDVILGYPFEDELPPIEEAMTDLAYCVKLSSDTDISAYKDLDIMDPNMIDLSLFGIYRKDTENNRYVRYTVVNNKLEPYYTNDEDLLNDKIIKKALKKKTTRKSSSRKKE